MTLKGSLYERHIKEREGLELLEDDWGFTTYRCSGEECFMSDFHVSKEARGSNHSRQLLSELCKLATDSGCKYISANVDLRDPGANHTLAVALHLGFKVSRAGNDRLLIILELGA